MFENNDQFREVMDRMFALMSEDPEMGPRLRDADVPQRFEFADLDLVVNIRAAREGEDGNLHWEWTDDVDWEPRVRMTMSSEVANQLLPGQGERRDGDRAPADQDRRRRQGGARADPDHQAGLRALPGDGRRADYPHLTALSVDNGPGAAYGRWHERGTRPRSERFASSRGAAGRDERRRPT